MSFPANFIRRNRSRFAVLILTVMAGLSFGVRLSAQVTGSVSGSVVDRSCSVIAAAAVTLVSESTGVGRKSTTDSQGSFLFNAVAPGLYTLAVEHPGFRKHERTSLELGAGERLVVAAPGIVGPGPLEADGRGGQLGVDVGLLRAHGRDGQGASVAGQ